MNDPELSFREIVNKNVMSVVSSASFKSEIPAVTKPEKTDNDVVRVDQNQIVVTLEKGEGTLQIEKIGAVKKEPTSEEPAAASETVTVKSEPEETPVASEPEKSKEEVKSEEPAAVPEESSKPQEEKTEESAEKETEMVPEEPQTKETVCIAIGSLVVC